MPDIHWGYGFPIGGVAAFSLDEGVISPGGVGFDINCGVRLLTTPLAYKDVAGSRDLIEELFRAVPTGVGAKSPLKGSTRSLDGMMNKGARWAVGAGYGVERDLLRCEETRVYERCRYPMPSPQKHNSGVSRRGEPLVRATISWNSRLFRRSTIPMLPKRSVSAPARSAA